MLAVTSFLIIVCVSIIIVRVATVALMLTGLNEQVAAFQARSAYSGTGFTTEESEMITKHPLRRKIITILIYLQTAGLVTAISALVITFVGAETKEETIYRLIAIAIGLITLTAFSYSKPVTKALNRLIELLLTKYTSLKIRDYSELLGLENGYEIMECKVDKGSWLASKTLNELELPEEGVVILSIRRKDGSFVGAPQYNYKLNSGDTAILYGKSQTLRELAERLKGTSGEAAREVSEARHRKEVAEQDIEEKVYQESQEQ